ncbi:MAG: N-acetyltransferase [Variovorax paradoxus]|uniref:N-acetyltransferase n=1 Tax=Variovorax paradoxus TaxID=34073 RepID=A0A2W5SPR2_VARPD|nr:MAG: N-acetyltransferase [Variovorax paradoxus]
MTITIDEIRQALDKLPADISLGGKIASDLLANSAGEVPCDIHLGWDLQISRLCDRTWGAFNNTLMRHIRKLEVSGTDIAPILAAAQLEDHHWKWLDKALHYKGDAYKWFFLVAEKYPQAACMIYHPRASVASEGNVFYIEYLAVAPWNRENALSERVFKGVGPKLLSYVVNYAQDVLKLKPGFSLHSLPKAADFYEKKLKMTPFPKYDKDGMKFFEWIAPKIALEAAS